jgi:hypothetical protein
VNDIITDLSQITEDTVSDVLKSVQNTSQGYGVGLNLTGINLAAPAKNLFPFLAPFRNRVARVMAPNGAAAAQWKAITGINVTNQDIFTPFGAAGGLVTTTEQDYAASYKPIALGDSVQWDAEDLARGYEQLRAGAGIRLLYALMIKEDQGLLGASNVPLNTPAAPSLTPASTGGQIAASTTVNVTVSARSLSNYFNGGGTVLSPVGTANTAAGTATNSVSVSVGYVKGAVAYDWFVNGFYYTSTTVNVVTVTSIPTADAGLAKLPSFDGGPVTAASRAVDSSSNPNAFNGLFASLYADYNPTAAGQVLNGTGIPSGARLASLNGATLTGANGGIVEIDNMLQDLWDYSRISPTAMLVSSQQGRDITRKVIASGGAYTLFQPDNIEQRRSVVGGTMLETYLNPAVNGQPIEIVVMPHIPAGTISLVSERLPYPSSNVENVLEIETQREYSQVEYAMSRQSGPNGGPRYDFEVRAIEVMKNHFPAGMGLLQNIAAG